MSYMRLISGVLVAALGLLPVLAQAEDCPGAALAIKEGSLAARGSEIRILQFREAVKLCPGLADAHYNLGAELLLKGEIDAAERSFRDALKTEPRIEYMLGIAETQLRRGNYSGAETSYKEALSKDPRNPGVLQGLSVLFVRLERYEEAEDALRQALQSDPNNPGIFYNLGVVLERRGRLDEAVVSYRAALTKRPKFLKAELDLARVLTRLGRMDQAESVLEQARLHEASNVLVWLTLSHVQEAGGNFRAAQASIERALEIDGKNKEARVGLEVIRAKRGELSDAIVKLEGLRQEFAEDAVVLSALGWAYLQNQDFSKSEEMLLASLRANGRDAAATNNLGILYEQTDRQAKAQEFFKKAREIDPELVVAQENSIRLEQ